MGTTETTRVVSGHQLTSAKSSATGVVVWAIVLLPTVLAVRAFSNSLSIAGIGVLTLAVFIERPKRVYPLQPGPIICLAIAAIIVVGRSNSVTMLIFLLIGIMLVRIVTTKPAGVVIASLIDGLGLFLIVNVLGHFAGLQSPEAADRLRESLAFEGFVRTIFPFSPGLDVTPAMASIFIAGATMLIRHGDSTRRAFRLTSMAAAAVILLLGASRTSLFVAIALPLAALLIPGITGWIAQALTLFASFSALLLPPIFSAFGGLLAPLLAVVHGRSNSSAEFTTLTNRDYIWSHSIQYWIDHVHGIPAQMFGFGASGQTISGAWVAYGRAISATVRHPERATMHNTFLQQVFDGGLIGWLLLAAALYWASVRLSHRQGDLGAEGKAAVLALSASLMNSVTQVSINPGSGQDVFWVVLILVAVACQTPRDDFTDSPPAENPLDHSKEAKQVRHQAA